MKPFLRWWYGWRYNYCFKHSAPMDGYSTWWGLVCYTCRANRWVARDLRRQAKWNRIKERLK